MSDDGRSHDESSHSGSRSRSRSSSRSRGSSTPRSHSRSRSSSRAGSRSSSGHGHSPASDFSDASGESNGQNRSKLSLQSLRTKVKEDIDLQISNVTSDLDHRKILAMVRDKYKVKGLTEAYVPNSRVEPATGQHVAGCPCEICYSLDHTLDKDSKLLVTRIRAIRNWNPRGEARPLCLLIPATVPASGIQPPPYVFYDKLDKLRQLEKAFASGISLHPLLHQGKDANSAPNISTKWAGGSPNDSPIRQQSSQSHSSADFKIPKAAKAINYIRDGPKSWDRFIPKESCSRPAKYVASNEAMKGAADLMSLTKVSLDKSVKDWSHEHLMLPARQFDQIKVQRMPTKIDSIAKMDGAAKVRENALSAVGASFNYAVLGCIRLSESVAQLDELIPFFELHLGTLDNISPPVYVSPSELKDVDEIKSSLKPGQKIFHDPATRWGRSELFQVWSPSKSYLVMEGFY